MQQKLVQYNFNASAKTYLEYAQIQKISALKIVHKLPEYYVDGFVLDLGSGPGTMQHCLGNIYPTILYDLSLKMLVQGISLASQKNASAINGDASCLPFAVGSIQNIISNLMLQWAENKSSVLQEIKRVLAPDGIFMFTTLISPSLWQLKTAWSKLDNLAHSLDFLSNEEYTRLIKQSGLKIIHSESWENIVNFTDIYALMRHFKLTGTTLPKSNMGNGLGGSKLFRDLQKSYPQNLSDKLLPLSYQYLFIIAKHDE